MMVVNRRRCLKGNRSMWTEDRSALQTLHKVSSKAREQNYFQGGLSHDWVDYYEQRIESDRSCLNEWHAMDSLESRRPPSPGSVRTKPRERDETEKVIRDTLKEIMMSLDLDEVTSKYIRSRLEEDLDVDLGEFKPFIDQEIMTIFGQMDAPTEVFDHVYLGSEWNASNFEELQKNGVGHILNVTREIDNFFPGTFDYLNVRVYDDEKTDLLKYWDNTFKYITKARKAGSKVLVHCKMGVSRSASVVIAYAMKAYDWDLQKALKHVKDKRSCIKPNSSFISQLETYQGILDAMKNKEKLQRSKSETNLKSPGLVAKNERALAGSEPSPEIQTAPLSGQELRNLGARPKSWSPEHSLATKLLEKVSPLFLSLENLNQKAALENADLNDSKKVAGSQEGQNSTRNVLMPFHNGQSYSVSPNQIMHIPGKCIDSVKRRVNSLESKHGAERKKLVLNLAAAAAAATTLQQQENCSNRASPETEEGEERPLSAESSCVAESANSQAEPVQDTVPTAVLVSKETWDPGETGANKDSTPAKVCNAQQISDSKVTIQVPEDISASAKTKVTMRREGDPFSNQLDRVFDREERKQHRLSVAPTPAPAHPTVIELSGEDAVRECPSRQSSWSSYDSAVVLGYQGEPREAPSRHSSWGSGDTRTLPSRNSSWGSYDMRTGHNIIDFGSSSSGMFPYDKDEIPWYPGTVKRTKQKLEEGSTTARKQQPAQEEETNGLQRSAIVNKEIDIVSDKSVNLGRGPRLSASAPECSSMDLLSCQFPAHSQSVSDVNRIGKPDLKHQKVVPTSVKHMRKFLENLHVTACCRSVEPASETSADALSGIVKNLKKEFEAKTKDKNGLTVDIGVKPLRLSSLPSSPISCAKDEPVLCGVDHQQQSVEQAEDISVRMLVDKYETDKEAVQEAPVPLRPKIVQANKLHSAQNKQQVRHSCFEILNSDQNHRNTQLNNSNKSAGVLNGSEQPPASDGDFKRPPVPPKVVVATVIAKAAKKQQQYGKSHPLARLNIKPRHNSPVYNTM